MTKAKWKIIARHNKWVAGAVIVESYLDDPA